MVKTGLTLAILLGVGILALSCAEDTPTRTGMGGDDAEGDDTPRIRSARIVGPARKIPSLGDLWHSTWANDDALYVSWGDGTGPGICYPVPAGPAAFDPALTVASCAGDPVVFCDDFCGAFACDGVTAYAPCVLTQAGLMRLRGPVADFSGCDREDCIRSIHIPTGVPQFELDRDPTTRRGDKPSALLALGDTLYWSGHQLTAGPGYGYIAYSTDRGATWTEVPDSPWTADSPFRVLMLINMGRDYELNRDGYVYGLGIHGELTSPPANQPVYLVRVRQDSVASYDAYRYFTGLDHYDLPRWSFRQSNAVPLKGLSTIALGAAMYHAGVEQYLFLAVPERGGEPALTLFAADAPWGPWVAVQSFPGEVYIPGIISKDTGPTSFYFTGAGGGGVGDTYQLGIARMEMQVR